MKDARMARDNPYHPKNVVSSRLTRVNFLTSDTQGAL